MGDYDYTQTQEADALEIPACTTGCVINSRVGGDHAYCGCHCHVDTLPAIPPSRERISIYEAASEPAPCKD